MRNKAGLLYVQLKKVRPLIRKLYIITKGRKPLRGSEYGKWQGLSRCLPLHFKFYLHGRWDILEFCRYTQPTEVATTSNAAVLLYDSCSILF
jgi:hypothetical protein